MIFDGAHNPQGISSAVESIAEYFGDERLVAVSGVLKDKDYEAIAKEISKVVSHTFTITPDSPRALPAEEYARVLENYGVAAQAHPSVNSAVRAAITLAKSENKSVVCLGSLYTYSEVIEAVKAHKNSN